MVRFSNKWFRIIKLTTVNFKQKRIQSFPNYCILFRRSKIHITDINRVKNGAVISCSRQILLQTYALEVCL